MVAVIITGPSGSGKSTLALAVVRRTGWPLIAKDALKEEFFERLGCRSREESKAIGRLALDLMATRLRNQATDSSAEIYEGNLRTAWLEQVLLSQPVPATPVVQVQMAASGFILRSRIHSRAASGQRHPAHFDASALRDNVGEIAIGRFEPARVPGPCIKIDTDVFSDQIYDCAIMRIVSTVENLNKPRSSDA